MQACMCVHVRTCVHVGGGGHARVHDCLCVRTFVCLYCTVLHCTVLYYTGQAPVARCG